MSWLIKWKTPTIRVQSRSPLLFFQLEVRMENTYLRRNHFKIILLNFEKDGFEFVKDGFEK